MSLETFDLGDILAHSARTIVRRAVSKDGTTVIVKTLAKPYPSRYELEQLESEFRILRKLDGVPNVVRAQGLERDHDRPSIIVEDFGGEAIPLLATTGALPLEQFFAIASAIATALGGIHARRVVHKDVKPSNIVVNLRTNQIKLIDFDVAIDLAAERGDVKRPVQFEGSLPYMSPEQTGRMNRELDYRADYYSLGVTCFELLTGELPFAATDMMGWVHCHISRLAPDVRSVNVSIPESLARIVRKLMEKNPDDRYQSAHGLLKDLERARRQWIEGHKDVAFALGQHDVSERFQVSPRLYAREREMAAILDAFDAATRGSVELVLLTGGSGAGKTALVRDAEREILSRQGRFISGQFEPLDQAAPYAAFAQALRALIKRLLIESDDRLAEWKRTLGEAVGPSGHVLVDLIPEMEQVLGPQAAVPELGPEEAHPRFRRAVQGFIKAVARPEAPLVLFLDNLQWSDPSTLELLGALVGSNEIQHLLVIVACRDDEANEGRLASIQANLTGRTTTAPRVIAVPPLSEQGIRDLLMATTRTDATTAAPLARSVHQKTGGNPFFVHELLSMLARDGAFHLISDEGRWDWDREAVDRAGVSDNVVDLTVQRLRRLQPRTGDVLCLAACIGETFDIDTLKVLADLPAEDIAAALRDARDEGILLHAGDESVPADAEVAGGAAERPSAMRYRFQHARLQQAAYSMLSEEERARRHLQIGRRLRANAGVAAEGFDDKVFEIVGHLNRARALIADLDERRQLAELNIVAAKRAKRSTAFAFAVTHLEIALGYLSDAEWADTPMVRFETGRVLAECLYLAGDLERANTLGEALAASAPDAIAAASVLFVVARIFDHQARYKEAIEVIRKGLGRLGIDLPQDPAEIDRRIGEGIGRMQAYLHQRPIEDLARLPQLADREKAVAMDLLFQLIPSAIQTYPPLFVLGELIMFDLATTHGVNAASCKNFVDCGIIQGGVLGDYAGARRLAMVAFELLKQYAPTPLEAGVSFVFAHFVSHWRAPYRESLEAFARAKRIGQELGNVGHTAYAYALELHRLFWVGHDLDRCAALLPEATAYQERVRARGILGAVTLVERAIARLRGPTGDAPPAGGSETEFTAHLRAIGNASFLYAYGQSQTMVNFLLGDLAAATTWEAFTTSYLRGSVGVFSLPDHHLFQSLIIVKRWGTMSADERTAAGPILDANLAKLAKWADNCPENFAHKHKIAAAEIGRLRGAPLDEVLRLFDEAIGAAGEDFPHMRALTNELQAEMWIERGQRKLARAFIQEAYYLYDLWGAHAKVRQLEQAYPEWVGAAVSDLRTTKTTDTILHDTMVGRSLDLASAMKATRAISGEVTRERLYARLMATIVENAGAQRGCLMVVSDAGTIEIVSRAATDDDRREPTGPVPIEEAGEVCVEVVRYVARTGEAIVLDDAVRHGTYGNDPYIRKSAVKSVLCLPVLNQGKLLAILYVENRAVTHAFTTDRLQLLQLIASQAAVSISNARLYDSLEEKVGARTRELAARNVDLERAHDALRNEMKTRQAVEIELRQAQKLEAVGRLASGVAHEINTPIQFVTDSVNFLKEATKELLSLFDQLKEVQRLVLAGQPSDEAARAATEAEEEADLPYLVENIPLAFERSLDGLERVASIVRSMKEFAHPDAKQMVAVDMNRAIDSTLTMSRSEYKYVADIDAEFGNLPTVLCHAGEVNQAVLNIIVNAAHAIGDVVKGTDRRGVILVRTEREGDYVAISIADTGGGIPESIRDRIFDPFFTTKEVGRGTGQGLAIARSVIVDKHGGTLSVSTEVGKGTTFVIRLPIAGKRDAAVKAA